MALELAHYLDAMGSRVTIVQRSAHLLKGMDKDGAKVVENAFRKRGMEIFTKTKLLCVERSEETRRVIFEHEGCRESRRSARDSQCARARTQGIRPGT